MLIQVLLVAAGSCVLAVIASIVMTRASNRSPAWNVGFGAALGLAVLLGALVVVMLLTRTAFGP